MSRPTFTVVATISPEAYLDLDAETLLSVWRYKFERRARASRTYFVNVSWQISKRLGSMGLSIRAPRGITAEAERAERARLARGFDETWVESVNEIHGGLQPRPMPPTAAARRARRGLPVVLSYGMGVDSTVLLVEWLTNPNSRDFDLRDLTVITAQVGDEFKDTKRLVEKYLFPLMRKHRIRFIQVARLELPGAVRRGAKRGLPAYEVLDDTRSPRRLYIEGGHHKISDEFVLAGTVPQWSEAQLDQKNKRRGRLCTFHWKGEPLDALIEDLTGGQKFRHVIGFNRDELSRVKRDQSYSGVDRKSEYPLVEWGWGRIYCEQYLKERFKERWTKSCCTFCPFVSAPSMPEHLQRWERQPRSCAEALLMEYTALALNPTQTLYPRKRALHVVEEAGLRKCLGAYARLMREASWALYRVRRAWRTDGGAKRATDTLASNGRAGMERRLRAAAKRAGKSVQVDEDHSRVVLKRRPTRFPGKEEMLAVAPAGVEEKRTPGFDKWWKGDWG